MALALLDGTAAAVDTDVDADGAGGSATVSVKCQFRVSTCSITQGTMSYVTFCSSNWVENRPTIKQATASLLGYASKGTTYSKPGSLLALTSATIYTATIDTGCTIAFTPVFTLDTVGITAFGESTRIVELVSSGTVTVTWVTS